MRLVLLVGYIWAIGFMPDIKRVFAYHGAEHKTINAYEAGAELTPEIVAQILAGTPALRDGFPADAGAFFHPAVQCSRPLTIGLATGEPDRADSGACGRVTRVHPLDGQPPWESVVRWLIKPNLALQSLTTREPDASMLEVAIAAFKTMRRAEQEFAT